MAISQRNGLHEVHTLSVDLDERENIPGLHSVTERVQFGQRVRTLLSSKALLCVFGHDEVFPRLPVSLKGIK